MKDTISRDEIKEIRPSLPLVIDEQNISKAERFQNLTLRPICKFQHELLKEIYLDYLVKRKGTFYKLDEKKKQEFIRHSVEKDLRFRSMLIGLIVGHFTSEEYKTYQEDEPELRKRLTNLITQRLQSMQF